MVSVSVLSALFLATTARPHAQPMAHEDGAPRAVPVVVTLETCPPLAVGASYRFQVDGWSGRASSPRWEVEAGTRLEVQVGRDGDLLVLPIAPSLETGDVVIAARWRTHDGEVRRGSCETTVVEARIHSLTFGGVGRGKVSRDCSVPPCLDYGAPDWVDDCAFPGARCDLVGDPVTYVAGSTVVLEDLVVQVRPADFAATAWVEGRGPAGLSFAGPVRIADGEAIPVHGRLGASDSLPDTVAAFEPFEIRWELSLTPAHFPIGVTRNPLFVTWAEPMGDRLVSYFAIGSRAAAGEGEATEVVDAVWEYFATLQVANATGDLLGYYRGVTCAADLEIYDAPGLVTHLNGQCGAWQDLFIQVLRTQGIVGAMPVTVEPIADDGFLVQRYRFEDKGRSANGAAYPYTVRNPCAPPSPNREDVEDLHGLRGQDEGDPASLFARHFMVKLDGRYYDPSYGRGPFEGPRPLANQAWEETSLAGFVAWLENALGARKNDPNLCETTFDR